MTDTNADTKRTRIALAVASAMTTLAVGVTVAALLGYLHPPSVAPPPVAEPDAPGTSAPAAPAPIPDSEPAMVLVPVEQIDTTPTIATEALAYADYDAREYEHDDEDDDADEHEGRDDD